MAESPPKPRLSLTKTQIQTAAGVELFALRGFGFHLGHSLTKITPSVG